MHRQPLLQQLKVYLGKFPEEKQTADKFIDFITSNEDCFQRQLSTGHITASCWLLNTDVTKTLFCHHKKLKKWLQLGGHADGDSNALAVAMKEAQEESGIDGIETISKDIYDIDVHLIPANGKDIEHYHFDVRFLLKTTKTDDFMVSDESEDLAWFSKQQLAHMPLEVSLQRMLDKWN